MSRLLVLFAIQILLYNCKPAYNTINGINKKVEFDSHEQYFSYVDKKTSIDLKNFYVVSNHDYNQLLSDVINRNVTYYYGIIQNEKLLISGSNLKDKKSCSGSIRTNINKSLNAYSVKEIEKSRSIITELKFTNPYNKVLKFDDNKKTVVYLYSYKLGKLTNNITDIINETSQNNINSVIISIDNLKL